MVLNEPDIAGEISFKEFEYIDPNSEYGTVLHKDGSKWYYKIVYINGERFRSIKKITTKLGKPVTNPKIFIITGNWKAH